MNDHFSRGSLRPHLVSSIMESLALASSFHIGDMMAAIKIQSMYRMWRDRRYFLRVKVAVVCIQRIFRGHMHWRQVMDMREEKERAHEMAVYEFYAARIQACFRGYLVRKYEDNFYARRWYIQNTMKASEAVQESAALMLENQIQSEREKMLALHDEKYRNAVEQLHHMVSTVSVSGVYRRPMNLTSLTTVYASSVEDDIRHHVAKARRPKLVRKIREELRAFQKTNVQNSVLSHRTQTKAKPGQGDVLVMEDASEGRRNFVHFSVLPGVGNQNPKKGGSLPCMSNDSSGSQYRVGCKVVSHSCLENLTPLYDTDSAELARRVDARRVLDLHKNKPFVVPAAKRLPL